MKININYYWGAVVKIVADTALIFIAVYLSACIISEDLIAYNKSLITLSTLTALVQIPIFYFLKCYSEISKYFELRNVFSIFYRRCWDAVCARGEALQREAQRHMRRVREDRGMIK